MPSITIRDPRPNTAATPYISPIVANGRYTKDDPTHTVSITGVATYTHNGVNQSVAGTGGVVGKVIWELSFVIPHPGVSVTITVTITEQDVVDTDSDTVSGIVMGTFITVYSYFTSPAAPAPIPSNLVKITFIGTTDPNDLIVVGRSRGPLDAVVYCQFLLFNDANEEFYTTVLRPVSPLPGNWWVVTLPVPQADRELGLVEALLVGADGKVLSRDPRAIPSSP